MKIRWNILSNMFVLISILTLLSCKNESKQPSDDLNQSQPSLAADAEQSTPNHDANREIPDVCSLIDVEVVKAIFNVPGNVGKVDISSGLKPYAKTCNFYWDNGDMRSNIIIQIQEHTPESGLGTSATRYIDEMVTQGLAIQGVNERIPFNAFDAGGRPGAYSFPQSRCFWAADDFYSFMVVANIGGGDEKRNTEALGKLAKALNGNLAKVK